MLFGANFLPAASPGGNSSKQLLRFWGRSLPDLLQLIAERRPTLLGLSLSIYFNLPALLKALDAVSSAHPDLPVLVGGQAFRWGGLPALQAYSNVFYIASLDELEQQMLAYE